MVKEIRMGLNLNGAHQPLVYVDDMNMVRDTIDVITKNRKII
jgi:hypothetical protein